MAHTLADAGCLGLDPDDEVVYRALLEPAELTVTLLVEAARAVVVVVREPRVAEALARLEQWGLVEPGGR